MGFKVAVVGATGNVGRVMLDILEERAFPADEVVALASRRSQGSEVSYGDRRLKAKIAKQELADLQAARVLARRSKGSVQQSPHSAESNPI